jgi:hypothetical protein
LGDRRCGPSNIDDDVHSSHGISFPRENKKGSGTVVPSTLRAVSATVPDRFLNHKNARTNPSRARCEIGDRNCANEPKLGQARGGR